MKKYLILISMFLLLPITVNAASANIDISASPNKASIGNKINITVNVNSTTPIGYYEYTLDYDHDKLELTSGKSYNIDRANNSTQKSFKKQFTFKVKSNGSNRISVKSYAVSAYGNNDGMSVTVNPAKINSSEDDTINQSDNNYLSSLEIENYKFEPTFSKNTTNYILKIEDDISEINVIAKADNSKASIIGDGKHKLKNGDNRIEVTVTSESGKDKIYTIRVRLSEKSPITVSINGKRYTIVKNLDSFGDFNGYKISKIKIEDNSVDSLYSSITNLTLVGLKDDNGNSSLYIYNKDSDTYEKYIEIKSNNLTIIPVVTSEKLSNYDKYTETISGNEVDCYKVSESSKYCVIYGMNTATGEKRWYTYNLDDGSIQNYDVDNHIYNDKKTDNGRTLIYILSGTTLLFGIMTIVFAIKSQKRRKGHK